MPDNKSFSILIIDDNVLNNKLMEMALTKEGYRVLTSSDGPTGRHIASELHPDLILLDIIMPGENGFEVIKKLKKNAETASIPIIFITGKDDLDTKIQSFNFGAVDYITKPFHTLEVIARIRLHLKLSLATNYLIASQTKKLKQIHTTQQSMLISSKSLPKANFAVWYKALLEAGGDFYDIFQISEEIYGYFIADVSGHDIATGFITAAVKVLLKQNCLPMYSPMESMQMLNNILTDQLPGSKYITACYAKLNRKSRRLTVVNAGHPPLIFIPKEREAFLVELTGDVIGMFKNTCFESIDIKVNKGDRFVMITDGVIENPQKRKIWTKGMDEIKAACEEIRDVPIQDAPEKLKNLIINNNFTPEDDMVILCAEV
ncbi:MAG TPA: histidine kinase [Desulfobacteraceae bacterium]|nr:histidine kinase [Desulfobacteraceae bacterium]